MPQGASGATCRWNEVYQVHECAVSEAVLPLADREVLCDALEEGSG